MSNEVQTVTVGGYPMRAEQAIKMLAGFETQVKEIEKKQKAIKDALLAAMEQNGVVKIETPEMLVNYIAASTRESFDTATFKKENPDAYDLYCKITPVKPSLRVKLR